MFSSTGVLLAQLTAITRAAAQLHDEYIGVGDTYHLFRLPENVEQDVHTFATRIVESLNLVDSNFTLKRRIVEMLDVEVALHTDDQGQKYAQASCVLGGADLSIASMSTRANK